MVVSRIRERTDSDMSDHEEPNPRGLFGGVFARGGVEADDTAWLQAMLDAEAGLARALERAGLAPAGSGEAITAKLTTAPGNGESIGGLKVTTANAWFAARPSGTENVYKIYAESFLGADHLTEVQEAAKQVVSDALG